MTMKAFTLPIILVAFLVVVNGSAGQSLRDDCAIAFFRCAFRFQGSNRLQTFTLGDADKPFTPQIVSSDFRKRIGILNSNGIEPQFIDRFGNARPITSFGNRFTPTQFKPYAIPQRIGSGIGHETFQDNAAFATRKCVRVFFTSYQLLRSVAPPVVVDNINLTPQQAVRMGACVVFRTA